MLCLKFSHENVTSKLAWTNFFNFQRYQQAPGSAPPSRDAPPPYPGVGGPAGGPTHGYGEGRGHYNRSRGASGGQGGDPRAQIQGGSRGHPASGQDRRSWAPPHSGGQRWDKTFLHILYLYLTLTKYLCISRGSRIEMSPITRWTNQHLNSFCLSITWRTLAMIIAKLNSRKPCPKNKLRWEIPRQCLSCLHDLEIICLSLFGCDRKILIHSFRRFNLISNTAKCILKSILVNSISVFYVFHSYLSIYILILFLLLNYIIQFVWKTDL